MCCYSKVLFQVFQEVSLKEVQYHTTGLPILILINPRKHTKQIRFCKIVTMYHSFLVGDSLVPWGYFVLYRHQQSFLSPSAVNNPSSIKLLTCQKRNGCFIDCKLAPVTLERDGLETLMSWLMIIVQKRFTSAYGQSAYRLIPRPFNDEIKKTSFIFKSTLDSL